MRNRFIRRQRFTRRALLAGGIKLSLLSVLGGRLYYLQVMQSDRYRSQAEGNRVRLFPRLPSRGRILDRKGVVLAGGKPRYQLTFDNLGLKQSQEIAERVARLLALDADQQARLKERIKKARRGSTIVMADYLEWDQVAAIEVNRYQLPGVTISSPEMRYYPNGKNFAHVIGYVGLPSQEDQEKGAIFQHPEFRLGKTGLERKLEHQLRGAAGVRHVEVDVRGHYVKELKVDKPEPGEDARITIDARLQERVVQALSGKGGIAEEAGAAVVLDIQNGDVLAMASLPSFDNNQFVRGVDPDYWRSLLNNPDRPLVNKAISMQYPPGSTFKMVVALAGLEAGKISPQTEVFCPGHYELAGREWHCWKRTGHGVVNLQRALAVSCNVYFYDICQRIGINRIAATARRLGLGSITEVELNGEFSGLVPDKAWKRREKNEAWYLGETLNASIGQGYLLATPLQLALMTARIANGGKAVSPRLILPEDATPGWIDDTEVPKSIGISQRSLREVMKGMSRVVNNPEGLVYARRVRLDDWSYAGKTGTAQVVSTEVREQAKRKSQNYHALFVGYAPVKNPRYSVAVVVEHGGYGSAVAAPIGGEILSATEELKLGARG